MFRIRTTIDSDEVVYTCPSCKRVASKNMKDSPSFGIYLCAFCQCILPNITDIIRRINSLNYVGAIINRQKTMLEFHEDPFEDFYYG